MLKFVILLSVIACAFGAAIPEGMLPQLDGRIVGGEVTTISQHPWQIALLRNNGLSCGGSIIKDSCIVTAAHCAYSVSASALKVRAGSSDYNTGGVLINVDKIIIHKNYNPNTMVYDVAILLLESSLTWSSTIKPIDLATKAPANGAPASVSGWGTTSFGGNISIQLRSVALKIVSESDCRGTGYGSAIKSTMICAYAVDKDACQGDSGGPLVSGGLLAGIVSWGYGCAMPGYPGVYCSVADVSEWIENVTNSS